MKTFYGLVGTFCVVLLCGHFAQASLPCLDSEYLCENPCKCQDYSMQCNNECQPDWNKCDSTCIKSTTPCNDDCIDIVMDTKCENDGNPICLHGMDPLFTWQCDGKCQLVSTPCDAKCPDQYFLCGSMCKHNHDLDTTVWMCNDQCVSDQWHCGTDPLTCQGLNVPCPDNKCPQGYYICESKCQTLDIPCNNTQCPDNHVFCNNTCKPSEKFYSCNGKCLLKQQPCDGKCLVSEEWVCTHDKCTALAYDVCAGKTIQCEGGCHPEMKKCGPLCLENDNMSKWECGADCIDIAKPCQGKCHKDYFICGRDNCKSNEEHASYYPCGFECFESSQVCSGHCNNHTQDIKCGNTCIAPDAAMWECGENCISTADACSGTCPEGSNMWACQNKCVSLTKPCEGRCPNGRCIQNDECVTDCNAAGQHVASIFSVALALVAIKLL